MNALNVAEYTHSLGLQAKTASALMAKAPAAIKNKALLALARLLREQTEALQVDNARDLERAREGPPDRLGRERPVSRSPAGWAAPVVARGVR